MVDRLLAVIAPHSCCSCGNLGLLLCHNCKNDIIYDPFERCLVCLKPTADSSLCNVCCTGLGVEGGWCVGIREGALKGLLDRYKFNSAREAGYLCADLLDTSLPLLTDDVVVVPVPTSPAHIRTRGFDHTGLVANAFARKRGLLYKPLLTRRSNDTQHFKSRSERLAAAANSIEVTMTAPPTVLLIDDIYTTGATLGASCLELQKAGVKHIFVAIIARQTLDESSDLW